MSWMTDEKPRDRRRKPKKAGRPKEEGGHIRLDVSFNKFVAEALEKVENKSKFIEEAIEPVLKQLDPGETCSFLYELDRKIISEVVAAAEAKNFERVMALSLMANSLEDYRKLCNFDKFPEEVRTEEILSEAGISSDELALEHLVRIALLNISIMLPMNAKIANRIKRLRNYFNNPDIFKKAEALKKLYS